MTISAPENCPFFVAILHQAPRTITDANSEQVLLHLQASRLPASCSFPGSLYLLLHIRTPDCIWLSRYS